tara:strand:- start:763 stop:1014 length:252 start_codon:yes stop_codon:yes gene_type:complete
MGQVSSLGLLEITETDMENRPELYGIFGEQMKTLEHRQMIRVNLQKQQKEAEEQITVLEGKLVRLKEYLAKIEGGLDVLDELD